MKDEAYCQPCVSPVWDTALVAHALMEAGEQHEAASRAPVCEWLMPRQVLDVKGDWAGQRPTCAPAAGPFSTTMRTIPISTTPPSW